MWRPRATRCCVRFRTHVWRCPAGPGRQAWHDAQPGIDDHCHELAAAASDLAESLQPLAGHSAGMDAVIRRAETAAEGLERIADGADADAVRWYESFSRSFVLHMTPPDAADALGRRIGEQGGSWIFTSATLAVGDDFSHYATSAGSARGAVRCGWTAPSTSAAMRGCICRRRCPSRRLATTRAR